MSRAPLPLPARKPDAHKGDFGRVLLVGGSRGMSGSISLSAMAALATGSGLVSAAVPDRCLETVAASHPCLMTIPLADDAAGRFSLSAAAELESQLRPAVTVGCGPGMSTGPGSLRIVERLLTHHQLDRVLDADALNALAELEWPASLNDPGPATPSNATDAVGGLILTPHPGELQRLVSVSARDRAGQIAAAQELALRSGAVIVVKGGPTVVVAGEHRWTNSTGNPGMATAGSGDVLTGVITSLLGQGLEAWDAARLGVWLHGRAGDLAAARIGEASMTALEIVAAMAEATQQAGADERP